MRSFQPKIPKSRQVASDSLIFGFDSPQNRNKIGSDG